MLHTRWEAVEAWMGRCTGQIAQSEAEPAIRNGRKPVKQKGPMPKFGSIT